MHSHSVAEAHQTITATLAGSQPVFTDRAWSEFGSEDAYAGQFIGKMLCAFFIYSLIVMAGVWWWTYRAAYSSTAAQFEQSNSTPVTP